MPRITYHDEAEALSYLIRRPSVKTMSCPTVVECAWSHAEYAAGDGGEEVCEVRFRFEGLSELAR